MIALDLDGTTLDSHHNLTQTVIQTLRLLSKQGLIVCIATGRSMDTSLMNYIKLLDLPQDSIPVVCYNGSYGYLLTFKNGLWERETVFSYPIQENLTRKLISFATGLGLLVQYYNGETGDILSVPQNDEHLSLSARYAALVGRKQSFISDYEEALSQTPSAKLLVLTNQPDDLIARATKQFCSIGKAAEMKSDSESESQCEFNIIKGSPDPFFVEFLPSGLSKGSALEALATKLGLSVTEEVAAFGDGDNDAEMLRVAAIGVAMRNAKQKAKEAADIVIEWSNDEDGVARQLLNMKEEGLFAF